MYRPGNELHNAGLTALRAGRPWAVVAAVWLSATAGLAQPVSTAPTIDPIDTIPIVPTQPAVRPAEPAKTIEEALAYTDEERTALEDVRDGNELLDGAALSILLRRAAMLPADRDIRKDADRPSPRNLWRRPADYRGRLITVEGACSGGMDMSDLVAPTTYHVGPVYAVVLTEQSTGESRPILVVMSDQPPEIPERSDVSVAGLFYKVVRLPEEGGGGKTAEYAVVVARGLYRPGSGGGIDIPKPFLVLGGLVVVLLMVFIFVWRRARAGPRRTLEYKPLRFEDAAEGVADTPAEVEQPGEVDEDLIRQAEDFKERKRHPAGDE